MIDQLQTSCFWNTPFAHETLTLSSMTRHCTLRSREHSRANRSSVVGDDGVYGLCTTMLRFDEAGKLAFLET